MKSRMVLINVEYSQIIVAEVHNGRLHALHHSDNLQTDVCVGDVYCGRVQNVVRGLSAAFVDIGAQRTALLPFDEIVRENDSSEIQAGQFLLVQVSKTALDEKGARLTTKLTLPGRFTVLTNETGAIGISQKVKSKSERLRLLEMVQIQCASTLSKHGVVVRTQAQNAELEEIAAELGQLENRMQRIKERFANSKQVGVLYRDNGLLNRLARDLCVETTRVVVDAPHEYSMLCELLQLSPDMAQRIELHIDARWVFDVYGVSEDYKNARERMVRLRSGGTLVFDEAESLTAIDVNTSQFSGKKQLSQTVLQTNMEASEEIARQLRLRNIGGVVVIDFIDMKDESARAQVLQAFKQGLQLDHAKTRIVHFSSLNLLQMTRERLGETLRRAMLERCDVCGDGMTRSCNTRADEARRAVRNTLANHPNATALRVSLPISLIEAFFGYDYEAIRVLESRWKIKLSIVIIENSQDVLIDVLPTKHTELPLLQPRFQAQTQNLLRSSLGNFVVCDQVLVRLSNLPEELPEDVPDSTLWCEITSRGNWFCDAQVILTGEAKAL